MAYLLNTDFCETQPNFSFEALLDDWHFESLEVREFYYHLPMRKYSSSGELLDLPLAELCSNPSDTTRDSFGCEDLQPETLSLQKVEVPKCVPVVREIIGTLTQIQRQEKLKRYLEKKQRRVWAKKIKYDCRKKVADSRVRVKGRFVSKAKAEELNSS